jgi:WD40 repeat protein
MAEQAEPVHRRVALKVIKLGMDTKQVIARFEAERQALAMMEHPNIAKVLDAGTTETGRPYFVMELIRGTRITEFCDETKASTEERLKLFVQVCQAVQHAHQKGIIHRDLKPSNILVTLNDGTPVPKVIDFGIAKATQGRLTDQTLFTAFDQFIGTPAYMSPEQAAMTSQDIDTRSDIYSLGVLLYELLTGRPPFDHRELLAGGLDEMCRTIREKEPLKPSTRLSSLGPEELTTTARARQTEAPRLVHLVKGDLDWIVMKCLEKDRTRRYETANGVAADIQRHLNDEPITARPPSRLYEFQKTVRRHKIGFAVATALVLLLALGVVISSWQAIRAARAERGQAALRQRAEGAETTAKQQEMLARRRFYAAEMNLAIHAWETQQTARALDLLESLRPQPGEPDLRGFEWFHLWDLCNARLRLTVRGSTGDVVQAIFSADKKMLLAGGSDGAVRVWELPGGRELMRLKPDTEIGISDIVLTRDGTTLIVGSWDGRVRFWDLASRELRRTLYPKIGYVMSVELSRDGKTLAIGGESGEVKFVDLATGAEQTTIRAGTNAVTWILFSRDGSTMVTASGWSDKGVKVWDLKTNPPSSRYDLPGPYGPALSYDDKLLASASNQPIQIRDINTGQLVAAIRDNPVFIQASVFLRDGRLVVGSRDRTIRSWQVSPGMFEIKEFEMIGTHLDSVKSIALSEDESLLASGGTEGLVKVWNVSESKAVAEGRFAATFQCAKGVSSILPLPGNEKILVSSLAGTEVRELASGKSLMVVTNARGRVALTGDASRFVSCGGDAVLRLWEVSSGWLIDSAQAHLPPKPVIAFFSDGRTLVTGGYNENPCELKLWEVNKDGFKLLQTLRFPGRGVLALGVSPDGARMAVAVRYNELAIVDARTMKLERRFQIGKGDMNIRKVEFSRDSRLVGTASESGIAALWNVSDGQLHAALKGHTANIEALSFAPDGETLATGGADDTVRLWDIATGQERGGFKRHRADVLSVAFSTDGKALISGDKDGNVWVLRAPRFQQLRDETVLAPGSL